LGDHLVVIGCELARLEIEQIWGLLVYGYLLLEVLVGLDGFAIEGGSLSEELENVDAHI
jgi:hypothetical protein